MRFDKISVDEIRVMCDKIEEQGKCVPLDQPAWVRLLFATSEQIEVLKIRLRWITKSSMSYRFGWSTATCFQREDIKALLRELNCVPVSHFYRQV